MNQMKLEYIGKVTMTVNGMALEEGAIRTFPVKEGERLFNTFTGRFKKIEAPKAATKPKAPVKPKPVVETKPETTEK